MSATFTLTSHANDRMSEIGVNKDLVLAAVRKPDRIQRCRERHSVVCSLDLSLGFTLAAVVDVTNGNILTVYPEGCERPAARRLVNAYKESVHAWPITLTPPPPCGRSALPLQPSTVSCGT